MSRRSAAVAKSLPTSALPTLAKCPTGIRGLDAITRGGIPCGRPTLVCGGSGSGKTLFGMEFLVRGIQEHDEPGVFMCFEERAADLAQNVASLGFDLPTLTAANKLVIDQVIMGRGETVETGEYDLDGLFIRLGAAIDAVGARRVVLDTIEALFAALTNLDVVRSELRRLFGWLKEKGVTAIVTGERGEGSLTRHGLEEHVCIGPDGRLLTGSARDAQEMADRAAAAALKRDVARKKADMLRRHKVVEAKIAELQADLAAEAQEVGMAIADQSSAASELLCGRATLASDRKESGGPRTRPVNGGAR